MSKGRAEGAGLGDHSGTPYDRCNRGRRGRGGPAPSRLLTLAEWWNCIGTPTIVPEREGGRLWHADGLSNIHNSCAQGTGKSSGHPCAPSPIWDWVCCVPAAVTYSGRWHVGKFKSSHVPSGAGCDFSRHTPESQRWREYGCTGAQGCPKDLLGCSKTGSVGLVLPSNFAKRGRWDSNPQPPACSIPNH